MDLGSQIVPAADQANRAGPDEELAQGAIASIAAERQDVDAIDRQGDAAGFRGIVDQADGVDLP